MGLEERSKHVKSKAKKLKKSVEEVNRHLSKSIIIWLRVASRTKKLKLQLFVQSKRAQAKSRKRKLNWRNWRSPKRKKKPYSKVSGTA